MNVSGERTELRSILLEQKKFVHRAFFFSIFINVLVMAPTFYMLEVYDRVLNSRSLKTLAWLTAITLLLLVVKEVLEWVRQNVFQYAARQFDSRIGTRVFDSAFEASLRQIPGASAQVFNDLRSLREFMPSTAMMAPRVRQLMT